MTNTRLGRTGSRERRNRLLQIVGWHLVGACCVGLFSLDALGQSGIKNFTPPKNEAGKSAWIALKFEKQAPMLCATTSASMVVAHYGGKSNQYEIKALSQGKKFDPKVPFTDFTVTTMGDLVKGVKALGYEWKKSEYATNQEGFLKGMQAIEKSLDETRPVLVDTTIAPPAHVITVVGYDKAKKTINCLNTLFAAPGIQAFSYADFERVWTTKPMGYDVRKAIFTAEKGKEATVPKEMCGPSGKDNWWKRGQVQNLTPLISYFARCICL